MPLYTYVDSITVFIRLLLYEHYTDLDLDFL